MFTVQGPLLYILDGVTGGGREAQQKKNSYMCPRTSGMGLFLRERNMGRQDPQICLIHWLHVSTFSEESCLKRRFPGEGPQKIKV